MWVEHFKSGDENVTGMEVITGTNPLSQTGLIGMGAGFVGGNIIAGPNYYSNPFTYESIWER